MLPDFSGSAAAAGHEVSTAVIDTRAGGEPRGGGFEERDTEIVAPSPPRSPGSQTPTVIASEHRTVSSRAPTFIISESDEGLREARSQAADAEEARRARKARADEAARRARAGRGRSDTPEPERRRAEQETAPSAAPPASALEEPTPSSAATQPTDPPPEYRSLTDDTPPPRADPMVATQPSHDTRARAPVSMLAAVAVGVVVLAGTFILGAMTRSSAREEALTWTAKRLADRAKGAATAIRRVMGQGRPDAVADTWREMPDLKVVRPDGTLAFVAGDHTTWRQVRDQVCDDPPGEGPARTWLGAAAAGGVNVCGRRIPDGVAAVDAGLGDLVEHADGEAWLSGDQQHAGWRILADTRCTGCHDARPGEVLGTVVASAPIAPLRRLGGGWALILVVGLGTAVVATVLVLLWTRTRDEG